MFKPLRDYILVKPDDHQSVATTTGIIIPQHDNKHIVDSDRQWAVVGVVMAVGPGKRTKKDVTIEPQVKIGDRVTWGEFMFPQIELDGAMYSVIQEADITAVIE